MLQHAQADLDHARVELRSGRFLEPPQRLFGIERPPVGSIGRHGVERVAGEDDSRLERDLLAGLAVGIAVAVPALMARAHDPADVLQLVDRGDDLRAELGMRLDQVALLLGQRPGLEENRVRNPDLADVVEESTELEPLQRVPVEAELLPDAERRVGDPAGV